jgi:hypothetical protein
VAKVCTLSAPVPDRRFVLLVLLACCFAGTSSSSRTLEAPLALTLMQLECLSYPRQPPVADAHCTCHTASAAGRPAAHNSGHCCWVV